MKTLVIPDVHHKWTDVMRIESMHPDADEVVFLGDYFDDFGDTPADAERTAHEVVKRLNRDAVMIVGNHDAPYMNNGRSNMCPGFSKTKSATIKKVMNGHWGKMVFFHETQGYLLSHAGFDVSFCQLDGLQLAGLNEKLHDNVRSGMDSPLLAVGRDRGGTAKCGGVMWVDIDSIRPIPDVVQIVGHSPLSKPLCITEGTGVVFDIDTHLKYHGLIEDGVWRIIDSDTGLTAAPHMRVFTPRIIGGQR